ncbi:MAG: PKD domain-containing protein [Bacteroidota bacterium]
MSCRTPKFSALLYLLILLPPFYGALRAQEVILQPDTFCVNIDTIGPANLTIGNLLANDIFLVMDPSFTVNAQINSRCFQLDRETGTLFFTEPPTDGCCDEYLVPYTVFDHEGCPEPQQCQSFFYLKIECPKPACDFVDLTTLSEGSTTPGDGAQTRTCISACENSTATYYTDYTPDHTYTWAVENGVPSFGVAPPVQVQVSWGTAGPPTSLTLYDMAPGGSIDTIRYCVELTPSPVADFTFDPAGGCADSEVCFTNTSTGAVSYLWDFGDGNFSTDQDACNTFAAGGTYDVTLYATSAGGVDEQGNQLCCCTDSIVMTIEIDSLPGPNIYWVSTLCEGDESVYWTDAEDCSSYTWSVTDANGSPLPFSFPPSGAQDSIIVNWGAGPSGSINLIVDGCTEDYCDLGTTVVVPIISSTGDIDGPPDVCQNSQVSYELPKWNGVEYQWTVTGGTIIGPDTLHQVNVLWGGVGTGTLSVDYGSDFLAGLPNQTSPAACYGNGYFEVNILGNFTITDFSLGQVCINNSSFVGVNSDYGGATFNWTISPSVPFTDFGTGISIDWPSSPGPGLYTVTATPDSPGPGDYCVNERTLSINVNQTPEPMGILGPLEYCAGDTLVYSIDNPVPGYQYYWTVTGGSLVSGFFTPNAVVHWTDPTSGTLSVTAVQLDPVFCPSSPISISPQAIQLAPITGIDVNTACINQTQTYSVLPGGQHPDTDYQWSITPDSAGTVINGQGSETVDIQWNNSLGTAVLSITATLCDHLETYSETLTLNLPVQPVITQSNDLCPGVPATLGINGALFDSILWSTGATTPSITIAAGGAYVVNTVDLNGCEGVASIIPVELPGPDNTITVAGPDEYCISGNANTPTGTTVDILAAATPDYVYEWYCNGVLQATTGPTFTHVVTDTALVFDYYFVVKDTVTDCIDTSVVKRIVQRVCGGGSGPGCGAFPGPLTAEAANQKPRCDFIDLSATLTPPIYDVQWFLPFGAGGSVVSGDLNSPTATVTFPAAECYVLRSRYFFTTNSGDSCFFDQLHTVCIPLVATIGYVDTCGTVSFSNLSTTLGGAPIDSVRWHFGDGTTSTLDDPVHTYTGSGPFTVVLAAHSGSCSSYDTVIITPGPTMNPQIILPPGPLCENEAIQFGASAPGAIQQAWDFGDMASFIGEDPAHAYAGSGAYTVTLTVEDAFGCVETTDTTITVSKNPMPVTISVSDAVLCDGEMATLSVPFEAGITYNWSNGMTGTSIMVGTAGSYTVTLLTGDSCIFVADSVAISVLPLPEVPVSGSPFICSGTPTTLSGPSGPYTYNWLDNGGGIVGTAPSITLGLADIPNGPFTLVVIDANGCAGSSDPIDIMAASDPSPVIELTQGSGCEGEANELSITAASFDPDLIYSWSTQQIGPSTIVAGAGAYTVVALDPATGCTGTASFEIFPLPDVCIVPYGCYESCIPDTICGPDGDLLTYQWYQDGIAITTDQCLIATTSGVYHLEVTNEFGCTATTDSLYLEMIDCDSGGCEETTTEIKPLEDLECCYAMSYTDAPTGTYGIQISSPDAELVVDPATIDPALQGLMVSSYVYQLGAMTIGDPIPASSVGNAVSFCLENPVVDPQTITIEYLDSNFIPICADTFQLGCTPEPPCVYVSQDTITCDENRQYELSVTICRPLSADFDIAFVQLFPESPAAADDLPLDIVISPPLTAMMPCTTITVSLTTMAVPGSEFCYSLVAHSINPAEDPTALCCSSEESYCLPFPDCNPCDDLGVVSVAPTDLEDCCYDVTLFNNNSLPVFDGISLCPLDPNAELTAFTYLGGPWVANPGNANALDLTPTAGSIPQGNFHLPEICLSDQIDISTDIEIKWMLGDSIVCRDTIAMKCEPDCGYLSQLTADCEDGAYIIQASIFNTSDYPISSAYVEFDPTTGLSPYDTLYNFPVAIPPGGSTNVVLLIGPPAGPGDEICVTIYIHEENDDADHLNCCEFKAIITLPDCSISDCACDDEFRAEVAMGYTATVNAADLEILLQPNGQFLDCDSIVWNSAQQGVPGRTVVGYGYDFLYEVPTAGRYNICMVVYRTDDNGQECNRRSCRSYTINPGPIVFPNPVSTTLGIEIGAAADDGRYFGQLGNVQPPTFVLFDVNGKQVANFVYSNLKKGAVNQYQFDVSRLRAGIYFLRIQQGDQQWTRKIVIQ